MLAAYTLSQPTIVELDRANSVQFVSGILNTWAIDNSLDELEVCLQDAQPEVALLGKIIDEYKAGKKAKMSADLAKLAAGLPTLLTACKSMTDDIARLEQWAQIFTDQTELISTITKNIMGNIVHFTNDIMATKSDLEAGEYYTAGGDVAKILEIALGPVPSASLDAVDANMITQFLSGLLTQFEVDNNLPELQACTTGAGPEVQLALTVLEDYKNKKTVKMASDIAKFTAGLPAVLSTCKSMTDDLARLEQWASIFTDQTELVSTITKHILAHPVPVAKDVKAAMADWQSGDYYNTGVEVAKLIEIAIGPVPKMMGAMIDLIELMSIPEFIGGFVFALLGESNLPEIDACYNGVSPLVTIMEDFVTELLDFELLKAIESLESFVFHFQLDFQPCMAMSDDFVAIENYFKQLTDISALIPTLTRNVLFHMSKIEADWAAEQADWAAGNYFDAGKDIGDIVILALGPIEEAEEAVYLQ